MKELLLLLLSVILLNSCITEQKCTKRYPAKIEYREITKDTIIYKRYDSLIFVYVPFKDTVYINKYIKVPYKLNVDTITKEIGLIGVKAGITNNNLFAFGYLTDSTITTNVQIKNKTEISTSTSTRKEIQRVVYIPLLVKILAYFGSACLIFVLAYLFFKLKRLIY